MPKRDALVIERPARPLMLGSRKRGGLAGATGTQQATHIVRGADQRTVLVNPRDARSGAALWRGFTAIQTANACGGQSNG